MKRLPLHIHSAVLILSLTSCGGDSNKSTPYPNTNENNSSNDTPSYNTPKLVTDTSTAIPTIDIDIQSSDLDRVAAWLVSQNPEPPSPGDKRWATSKPRYFTLFSPGITTIYVWVKDENGKIQGPDSKAVTYTLPTSYDEYSPDLLINNPQRAIGFIKVNADYWRQMSDSAKGGFFTYDPHSSTTHRRTEKSFLTQSRLAYVFSRAFMVTGDETYLADARNALDFLYQYGWDSENGGWYFIADENGELITDQGWESDYNTKYKWAFQQHYALLGPTAMFEASHSATDLAWIQKGYAASSEKLWDDRESSYGYFDTADYDWRNPRGKSFTATVDAITTHVLSLYLMTHNSDYLTRLKRLGNDILEHMVASIDSPDVLIGMVERFGSNWERDTTSWDWNKGYVGHVLKASWCLARIFLVTGDPRYQKGALKLMERVLNDGSYDSTFGGPYTRFDWVTGTVIDTHKNFWNLEQAVLGGLINAYSAPDSEQRAKSLSTAKESLNFFFKYLPDRQHGGIYEQTSADGSIVDNLEKAGIFKAGYHTVELAYYTYLYTNLLLSDRPASLYYYIDPGAQDRDITLTPIAIEDAELYIESVKLDGKPFREFDSRARTLHIPSGIGGKFQVTFQTSRNS